MQLTLFYTADKHLQTLLYPEDTRCKIRCRLDLLSHLHEYVQNQYHSDQYDHQHQ